MTISVSFIIPHKGRTDLLEKTIDSILSQDFDLNNIEIILVTQDKNPDLVRSRFESVDCLTVLERPETESISALRNYGVRHCHSSEYLAFLDSDISISESWTRLLIEALNEKPERIIVCAFQESSNGAGPIEILRSTLSKACMGSNVGAMSGQNLFLRISSFERIGGFPESLKTCEDTFFTSSAAEFGELFVSPHTSYLHLGEDQDYRQLFKKEIWRARSNLSSLAGRSVKIREIPSIAFPILVMGGLIAIPLLLAQGRTGLAIIAATVSWTPVVLYTFRLWLAPAIRKLNIYEVFKFYTIYFIARAIGSTLGLLRQ